MSTISDNLRDAAEKIEEVVEDSDLHKIHSNELKHTAKRLRELSEEHRSPHRRVAI